jgi:hypothetical protein
MMDVRLLNVLQHIHLVMRMMNRHVNNHHYVMKNSGAEYMIVLHLRFVNQQKNYY